ncbi:MAG TPA: hypothetical protein VNV25_00120 [Gemmatimonadaceae bacterium]|jgi:hypothetical protein|nr:hypothetical protein [Gemmatimonadaceae bacterium]
MRAPFVIIAGALALACTTVGPSPQRQGELRDVVQTDNGQMYRTTPDYAITGALPKPIDEAYAAMLLAYQKLGIETTTNDPNGRSVGNMAVLVVHRFNGEDLSRYFECGRDALGTPRADHYRITFAVISTLVADGPTATKVETLVTARGTDPGGGGSDLYCSTTGHLENEIVKTARQE